jgi:hypothetical protein
MRYGWWYFTEWLMKKLASPGPKGLEERAFRIMKAEQ